MTGEQKPWQEHRLRVAAEFITGGHGLEIAPWENPMRLPGCTIRYVDVDPEHFTMPDMVADNAEVLATVADESLDFILCCHVLEHCANPIRTVEVHLKKIRAGGHLFYVLPDADYTTCDKGRPITAWEHVLADYSDEVPPVKGDEGHLHVWNAAAYRDFFARCQELLGEGFEVLHFEAYLDNMEDIVVLRKSPARKENRSQETGASSSFPSDS